MSRLAFLILIVGVSACSGGGGSHTPTAPSPPPPVQVAGVWSLSETITAITGGECFASALQSAVNTGGTGTLQITQTGGSLTARATDDSNGASCDYTGTAGSSSWALNTTTCTASDVIGAMCPNGARRDIRLQTGGYNASTVTTTSASGTGAQTFNVFVANTQNAVGTLTISSRFTATRR